MNSNNDSTSTTIPSHLNLNVDLNALFSNKPPPHLAAAARKGDDGTARSEHRPGLSSVFGVQHAVSHHSDTLMQRNPGLFRKRSADESSIGQAAQIISSMSPRLKVPGREVSSSAGTSPPLSVNVPTLYPNAETSSGVNEHHNEELDDGNDDDNNPYKGYRDFSRVPDTDPDTKAVSSADGGACASKSPNIANFPMKLHEILSREEFSSIIAWAPHGRSWRVLKPKTFESKILPQFFRHGKYNSFTRQVNGWGFRRITQGPDHNTYYHEFFLRGLPHLCKRMRRIPATNGKISESTGRYPEPDFYRIHEINPLPDESRNRAPAAAVASSSGPPSDLLLSNLLSDPRHASALRDLGFQGTTNDGFPPGHNLSESAILSLLKNSTSSGLGEQQSRSLIDTISALQNGSSNSSGPPVRVGPPAGLGNYPLLAGPAAAAAAAALGNQRMLLSGARDVRDRLLHNLSAPRATSAAAAATTAAPAIDPLLARLQVEAASSHLINSRNNLLAAVRQEQQILAVAQQQQQTRSQAAAAVRPQMSAIERVLLMEALRRKTRQEGS